MSANPDKPAEISFDLSKQFLSISFAGIAFAIGLSTSDGDTRASWMFWVSIAFFALSSILGLLFMMRGAADFSEDGKFNIFDTCPRVLSIAQIILLVVGTALLLPLHLQVKKPKKTGHSIQITHGENSIVIPAEGKIEVDFKADGSFKITK